MAGLDTLEAFAKWLGGAAVFGVIVKAWQDRREKKTIRRHLYQEMLDNYENVIERLAIVTSLEGLKHGSVERFSSKLDIKFDMWNEHSTSSRKLLFSLPEANAISDVYGKFIRITNEPDPYRCKVVATEAAGAFENAVKKRKLNQNLLYELASDTLWAYIKDYLEGRREGYKSYINPF